MDLPDLLFYVLDGSPNDASIAVYAAGHDRTVNLADLYQHTGFDFSAARAFDARTGYRSKSSLTVPMRTHENQLLGVLRLINAVDADTCEVRAFTHQDQRLTESLASQAAIALSNRLLITQLEQLFKSFVKLINVAIDEKSPYTGGHCQRVPKLTMRLTDAAHGAQQGPLADFSMGRASATSSSSRACCMTAARSPRQSMSWIGPLRPLGLVETRFEVLKRDT